MKIKEQSPHRRLLLVDDDYESCTMMTTMLGCSEYEVIFAQTMVEGLMLAQTLSFDLCLLESQLSDGSGYELCQRIHASDVSLPIVFYSGAAYEKDRQHGLEAGAQAYLIKPSDLDQVEKVISELIAQAQHTAP